jgi:hypothetical protein
MPTAENAKLQYEAGQNAVAMSALSDSGDATTFESGASLWSRRSGFAPVIRPNGLLTGGTVIPAAAGGTDDIDVAALTCNLNGVVTSVSADADVAITRPATNVAKVCSVTINSSGAVAIVAGSDGTDTTFSETRGADGGPPFIPTDSIEIAQVRVTSSTAAVITADEIKQVVGLHRETAAFPPLQDTDYRHGKLTFAQALPAIHTGSVPKAVFASYATAIMADVALASNFSPSVNTHTVSTTPIYGRVLGSSQASLQAGSFVAYLEDGVEDPLAQNADEILWFRFYPDRFRSPYRLEQGKLGLTLNYPADDQITADCTITSESASVGVSA